MKTLPTLLGMLSAFNSEATLYMDEVFRLPKSREEKIKDEFQAYCKRNPGITVSELHERVLDKKRNPFSHKTSEWFLSIVSEIKNE